MGNRVRDGHSLYQLHALWGVPLDQQWQLWMGQPSGNWVRWESTQRASSGLIAGPARPA